MCLSLGPNALTVLVLSNQNFAKAVRGEIQEAKCCIRKEIKAHHRLLYVGIAVLN